MGRYIDKDKIAAEIEKRYKYWREKEFNSHNIESEIRMSECQHLMLLLNSIETKKVDLEKEIKNRIDSLCNLYSYMYSLFEGDEEDVYPVPQNVINELSDFAKYFYELGLTQKGE